MYYFDIGVELFIAASVSRQFVSVGEHHGEKAVGRGLIRGLVVGISYG
jgi:hypothetical protein